MSKRRPRGSRKDMKRLCVDVDAETYLTIVEVAGEHSIGKGLSRMAKVVRKARVSTITKNKPLDPIQQSPHNPE